MNANANLCFDAIARDTRWHSFTAVEQLILDDFTCRWAIKPGENVLEPGCGSGRLTAVLAELTWPGGSVVAFEASAEFISVASGRGLPPHVRLLKADAETLALPAAVFDHVVCFNVYPHLVPLPVITRRLVTTLRPGGTFWIAHTCSRDFVNAVHRSGPFSLHKHLLPPSEELRQLLEECGLDNVNVEDGADRFLAWGVRR